MKINLFAKQLADAHAQEPQVQFKVQGEDGIQRISMRHAELIYGWYKHPKLAELNFAGYYIVTDYQGSIWQEGSNKKSYYTPVFQREPTCPEYIRQSAEFYA